jgi:PDZ domain
MVACDVMMQASPPSPRCARGLAALILVMAALAPACASTTVNLSDVAAAEFSSVNYCPAGRIAVHPGALPAPAEVAADPQRLALFQASHGGERYFVVEGCEKSTPYVCRSDVSRRFACHIDLEGMSDALRAKTDVLRAKSDALRARTDAAEPETNRVLDELKAELAAEQEVRALAATLPPGKYPMGFSLQHDPRGLRVALVVPGGQADRKLVVGDVIVAAEGTKVMRFAELWPILKAHMGGPVTLTVGRGGTLMQVVVKLGG